MQDAFNKWCEENNVENGYIEENGEQTKVPYWKLFKRWEQYWTDRIDPQTGEFPETTGADEFQKYLKENGGTRSTSGNWTNMGVSSSSGGYSGIGRLNCIGFSSTNSSVLYVGSPSGGLWKSADGGSTWTVLTDNNTVLGVSDVIVVAGTPDVLYIVTGDRDGGSGWSMSGGQSNDNNSIGVLKSTDGGATWNTTGLTWTASQKRVINRLLLDPSDLTNQTIYAATSIGVYKTTNGGTSWSSLTTTHFVDIEFKPGTSATIYGSTYGGDIYRSINNGGSWTATQTTSNSRTQLAVSANNPAIVYAVMANSGGGLAGVYKSTDSGGSFSQIFAGNTTGNNILGYYSDGLGSTTAGQGSYDLCIAADPNSASTVYIGGVNTWKSTNSGTSWTINHMWTSYSAYNKVGAPVVHADQHFLAFQNGTSTLFECNDGGLYTTSNGGTSWTDLSNGMVISQIYRLGLSQTASNYIMTGLQDNGSKAYINGSWSDVLGGDGFECAIKPSSTATQYGSLYYGRFVRTSNTWASDTVITQNSSTGLPINGLNEKGHWVTPFAIDPTTNSTIYVGMYNVWKSTNEGSAWTKLSSWSSSGSTLRSLAVAPSNSNYIYTATQTSFYRTTDGGSNWSSDLSGTLPTGSGYITYISVKADDPLTVWVTIGGYNAYGVYESTDGGSNWTNISSGLPSIPIMCVVQNKQNTSQKELYAGTDVGVYVKVGTANWTSFMAGLPNVFVPEIEIYYDNSTPANSRIRAATFGRGLWESDLYTPPAPPVAEFTANNTLPINNTTWVSFTDQSINAPTSWLWSITPGTHSYQGGTSSSSQNPQVTFTAAGAYSVTLRATNSQGYDDEIKTDYIHQGTPGLWTGTTSNAWNTTTNWENHVVPTSSTDVSITPASGVWPTYSGDFALGTQCNNLSLTGASEFTVTGNFTNASNTTLTCAANATIYVGGDWANAGTFSPGTGTVEFNGGTGSSMNSTFSTYSSLTSSYSATHYGAANFVDITALGGKSITVNSFDIHCYTTGSVSVEIWYTPASFSGLQSTPGVWTKLGSTLSVTGLGLGNPVNINPGTSVTIPNGVTYGFYISCVSSGTGYLLYNSTGNSYSNSDIGISIAESSVYTQPGYGSSAAVAFNGAVNYSYDASPSQTFNNLRINTSNATTIISDNLTVSNDLTIRSSAYLTNASGNAINVINNFALEADASGTASFIDNGTSSVTGSTNVQYYSTSDEWHYMSACFDPTGANFATLFSGNEPTEFYRWYEDYSDQGTIGWWIDIKNSPDWNDSTFRAGQGYAISDYSSKASTYTLSGTLYNTGKTVKLTKTTNSTSEGWNLVGNPFPCSVAANSNADGSDNFITRNTSVLDASYTGVYIYDESAGDYITITNGTAAAYISSGQGFMVRTAANNNTLSFNLDDRQHGSIAFYKGKDETQRLYLAITSPQSDVNETEIAFIEDMTYGLDPSYDAGKLKGNPGLSLYSLTVEGNMEELAVQVLPPLNEGVVVPLGFNAGQSGMYSFAADLQNFDPGIPVTLLDRVTLNQVDLSKNPDYSFQVEENGTYNNRFLIFFKSAVGVEESTIPEMDNYSIYAYGNQVYISSETQIENYSVTIYNSIGQLVFQEQFNIGMDSQVEIQQTGSYIVKVVSDKKVTTQKVIIR